MWVACRCRDPLGGEPRLYVLDEWSEVELADGAVVRGGELEAGLTIRTLWGGYVIASAHFLTADPPAGLVLRDEGRITETTSDRPLPAAPWT